MTKEAERLSAGVMRCLEAIEKLDAEKDKVVSLLKSFSEKNGQKALAMQIGVAPAYLNDLLKKRRDISRPFLKLASEASICGRLR